MTKLTKKILLTVFFVLIFIALFAGMIFVNAASTVSSFSTDEQFEGLNSAKSFANKILSLIKMVAIAIALAMLLFIGIKYVSANPEDKAKVKEHAITYLIGAICIFSAVGILTAIESLSKGLSPKG